MIVGRFDESRPLRLYCTLDRAIHFYLVDNFMSTRNTRFGLFLFAVYAMFYGGFVLLAAFSPQSMEATPLAGVNVAIWYGFALIVAAIALALEYGWACRSTAPPSSKHAAADEDKL